jgi:hypothetical protein
MIERFVTRVGKPGAIAILAAVIVAIGFGGAVVEHIRLAAATEQQGEPNSSQSGSKDQAGNSQESQGEDQASGARQQGGSTNDSAMSVLHKAEA